MLHRVIKLASEIKVKISTNTESVLRDSISYIAKIFKLKKKKLEVILFAIPKLPESLKLELKDIKRKINTSFI